ncbi:MAG: caspase family protein [Anaerolineales bacterium]
MEEGYEVSIPIRDVTIYAVGVDTYSDAALRKLDGPAKDVNGLRKLLVEDKSTALFKPKQFLSLHNPSSEKLRTQIDQYANARSANGDVLIFYYSGHGVSIGNDDFGFCTIDTRINLTNRSVLPLSVVKFSELLRTFMIAKIYPIIIIDACFSGIVGKSPLINPSKAFDAIKESMIRATSSYFLLCSCSEEDTVKDTKFGGVFSRMLVDISKNGLRSTQKNLSINNIFPLLVEEARRYPGESSPLLHQGPGIPDVPFIKNVMYSARSENFAREYFCILKTLWNKGKERELSIDELGRYCGRGAYSNHSKLSLRPWRLIEDVPRSKGRYRRLTRRGRKFIAGELKIPKKIVRDPEKEVWTPAAGTAMVSFKGQ